MNIWLCITLRANRVFYCKHTTHTVSSVHVCFGMTMEAFVTSGLLCMCKNPNMSGRENENSWPSLYVHTLCLYVCVCMYVFTYPSCFVWLAYLLCDLYFRTTDVPFRMVNFVTLTAVCVYVFMFVCLSLCMCVLMYVCVHVGLFVCWSTYLWVCRYVHM